MSPSTMVPSEALTYWTGYAQRHLEENPLLARVILSWSEFFPLEEDAAMGDPLARAGSSNLNWEDYTISPYPQDEEIEEILAELTEAVTHQMNLTAFNRLLELTTSNDGETITARSLEELVELMDRKADLFEWTCLWEGPVSVQTQLTWFAAWWIHDVEPTGAPIPPWVSSSRYPDAPIEFGRASKPQWFRQWVEIWMTHVHGADGPTSQATTD